MMITLKQWMEIVGYRITEGSDYTWHSYGDNAYSLDSWNGDYSGHSFSIMFDTRTQEVFEVQAHDYKHNRAYRIINPNYAPKYMIEAAEREVNDREAWENVDYVDLETDEDWLDKATAIAAGKDYDTRVSMPVEFTDEELLTYMKMAHERDMTFNQFIEEALRTAIEDYERDPEGTVARAKRWKEDHDLT
jgi:hypothetical protein